MEFPVALLRIAYTTGMYSGNARIFTVRSAVQVAQGYRSEPNMKVCRQSKLNGCSLDALNTPMRIRRRLVERIELRKRVSTLSECCPIDHIRMVLIQRVASDNKVCGRFGRL
jgi:hypothetical protein